MEWGVAPRKVGEIPIVWYDFLMQLLNTIGSMLVKVCMVIRIASSKKVWGS